MIMILFVSGCTMPWVQPKQTITGAVTTGIVKPPIVTTQTAENSEKQKPVADNKSPSAISIESASVEERQAYFDNLPNDPLVTNELVEGIFQGDPYTWWLSTHEYPELGIKIYSDNSFWETSKNKAPFIIKTKSKLEDPFRFKQYIKIVAKDPEISIEDVFDKVYRPQLRKDCKMERDDLTVKSLFTGQVSSIQVYDIYNNLWTCFIKESGLTKDHVGLLNIFYNTKRPDRYYLHGHQGDGYTIFNQIELY